MTDGLLVLNAGSSSLKFAVFGIPPDADDLAVTLRGQIANIGAAPLLSAWRRTSGLDGEAQRSELDGIDNHQLAIAFALDWIGQHSAGMSLRGVGHRVVHG
ncbi:MAG: acetate kinase, partial [Sedimenticolaceae bacterium]